MSLQSLIGAERPLYALSACGAAGKQPLGIGQSIVPRLSVEIIGQQQEGGRLIPQRYDRKRAKWYCQCIGKELGSRFCKGFGYVKTYDFKRRHTRSCGCLHRERAFERAPIVANHSPESNAKRSSAMKAHATSSAGREKRSATMKKLWESRWCKHCGTRMRTKKKIKDSWFDKHADYFYCVKCSFKNGILIGYVTDGISFEEKRRRDYYKNRGSVSKLVTQRNRDPEFIMRVARVRTKYHFTPFQILKMLRMRYQGHMSLDAIGEQFGATTGGIIRRIVTENHPTYIEIVRRWKDEHRGLVTGFVPFLVVKGNVK